MNGGPVEASGKKKRKGKDKRSKPVEAKNRLAELRAAEKMVAKAIEEGRIEDDLPGITMERVFSKASTKQAMVARVSIKCSLHNVAHD